MNSEIDGYIKVTPDEYHTAAKIKWCDIKKAIEGEYLRLAINLQRQSEHWLLRKLSEYSSKKYYKWPFEDVVKEVKTFLNDKKKRSGDWFYYDFFYMEHNLARCQRFLHKDRILYLSIKEYEWLFGK